MFWGAERGGRGRKKSSDLLFLTVLSHCFHFFIQLYSDRKIQTSVKMYLIVVLFGEKNGF